MDRRQVLTGLGAAALTSNADRAATPPDEPALLPQLPIIDPHQHFRQFADTANSRSRYLPADLLADQHGSGHRFVSTLFVECSIMYRTDGPVELRSLGETTFVRNLAEQPDAQLAGLAEGMIVRVDLTQGERVSEIAAFHKIASGGRLRGVRDSVAYAEQPPFNFRPVNRTILDSPAFRAGAAALASLNLTFDASVLHPQLAQLTQFARAVPNLTIVVNHLGCPIGPGPDARRMKEVFPAWKADLRTLAKTQNVVMKLGGLGQFWENPPGAAPSSDMLVKSWRPWIETGSRLLESTAACSRAISQPTLRWPHSAPPTTRSSASSAPVRLTNCAPCSRTIRRPSIASREGFFGRAKSSA